MKWNRTRGREPHKWMTFFRKDDEGKNMIWKIFFLKNEARKNQAIKKKNIVCVFRLKLTKKTKQGNSSDRCSSDIIQY